MPGWEPSGGTNPSLKTTRLQMSGAIGTGEGLDCGQRLYQPAGGGSEDGPQGQASNRRRRLKSMPARAWPMSVRDLDRLILGASALLSISRAAELLPVSDAEARRLAHAANVAQRLALRYASLRAWGAADRAPAGRRLPRTRGTASLSPSLRVRCLSTACRIISRKLNG